MRGPGPKRNVIGIPPGRSEACAGAVHALALGKGIFANSAPKPLL